MDLFQEHRMNWKNMSLVALGCAALIGLGTGIVTHSALAADEAGCPAQFDAMIAAAYPDAGPAEHGRIRLDDPARSIFLDDAACARMPGREGLTVMLVPIRHEEADEWLDMVGDLEVLVFADGSGTPSHRLLEQRLTSEDAIAVSRIEIDPARYDLDGSTPVFGVRIERANRARYNPGSVSTLRLYRIEEGRLEAILIDLAVGSAISEFNNNCEGEELETRRDVLVSDPGPNSLADLVVVGRTVKTVSSGMGEACTQMTEDFGEERTVLVFDGRSYPVPEALQGLDGDYQH
jgi:hypothetical protein